MEIKIVKLGDIVPYFNNARNNLSAVEPTKESIKRYGFIKPIIVDKKGVIICGHTRYFAAFQLGLEVVPVIYSDLDDEKAMQYRILDNKLAEKSSYNEQALIEELRSLGVPTDMQVFFFEDLDSLLNFSYNSINSAFGTEVEFDDDDSFETESDSSEEGYNEEQGGSEQEYDDPARDLYRVRIVDGKKVMKVICAYCGNIEEINVE